MIEPKPSVLRIQLFSVLREHMKSRFLEVKILEPMKVSLFLDEICAQHPELTRYRSLVKLAVNQAYARSDDVVSPGDEVALITPVSGG